MGEKILNSTTYKSWRDEPLECARIFIHRVKTFMSVFLTHVRHSKTSMCDTYGDSIAPRILGRVTHYLIRYVVQGH